MFSKMDNSSSFVVTLIVILWSAQLISTQGKGRFTHSSSDGDFQYGWRRQNEQTGFPKNEQNSDLTERYEIGMDPSSARLHPLDPLTEAEINATSSVIRNFRRGNWKFNYITLKEPEKSTLLSYFLKDINPLPFSIPRRSFSVLRNQLNNQAYEVVVNLDRRQVESWNAVSTNANLQYTPEEISEAERVVRKDKEVIERCRKLGWTDMNLVNADAWSMGYIGDRDEFQGKRIMQMFIYGKNFEDDNPYAHPFDFLPVVDINEGQVIAIEELPTNDDFDASNKKGTTVPRTSSNYNPKLRDPNSFRDDLHPVNVTQQSGSSFKVNGNEIEWQKFKMRIGFNGREGLVIHNVNYNDNGDVRPLFYRMSLAEMFVPYGDPRPPFHRKSAFDEGEFGIGFNANELKPQMDCVGEVHFFDGVLHNENGGAKTIPRVICVREEDAGILWKHTDYRKGESVLSASATPVGHGTVVFPQINAQYHQHFFTLRLDAEIDGNDNSVVVSDVVSVPEYTGSMNNAYGNSFTTRNMLLRTASEGRTRVSTEDSRTWHIRNANSLNPYTKQPVAWKLIPAATQRMLLRRDSPIRAEADWLDYNTWITPYQENQMFPGGFYLNSSGLPQWVGQNKNANIDNTDIVFWYNFGITHVPRVEDFPIMPVEHSGIMLKPMNFFKENPALDVPPPKPLKDEL